MTCLMSGRMCCRWLGKRCRWLDKRCRRQSAAEHHYQHTGSTVLYCTVRAVERGNIPAPLHSVAFFAQYSLVTHISCWGVWRFVSNSSLPVPQTDCTALYRTASVQLTYDSARHPYSWHVVQPTTCWVAAPTLLGYCLYSPQPLLGRFHRP